jgi:acyl CoA:acetate/3-ketoacid CoA transferase beta subunit
MSLCQNVIIILHQSRKRFPPRVDFITSPGYLDGEPNQREKSGLPEHTGPSMVITDLGTYRFLGGELVLASFHEALGVTLEDIDRETGWKVKRSPNLVPTEPPDAEYLSVLREKVDPDHLFVDGRPRGR